MHLLVVNPTHGTLPEEAAELVRASEWRVTDASDYQRAVELAETGDVDAVILSEPAAGDDASDVRQPFDALVQVLEAKRIAGVLLTDGPTTTSLPANSLIDTVDRSVSLAELRGRLAMIARYHGMLRRMERELAHMERLSNRLSDHFREVEQEMRLAGRLQKDFLPRLDEPIGDVRFGAVFRPASWVSGDIYDVFPITEHLTGFYVADAVGHGMAASLLTMFIKRAIVSKQTEAGGERVWTPSETMTHLNRALTEQALPHCQFVTACYGVIDHRTLTVRFSRGGHPHPLHLKRNGEVEEIEVSGSLLGVFPDEEFPTGEIALEPGDKLLLYTDGVELAFPQDPAASSATAEFLRLVRSVGSQPIDAMLSEIDARIGTESDSTHPTDDVTILALEPIVRSKN